MQEIPILRETSKVLRRYSHAAWEAPQKLDKNCHFAWHSVTISDVTRSL